MPTLFEKYITGDDTGIIFYGALRWMAMSFTPSKTHDLTSVKLKLYRVGSPGILTVSIQATTDGGSWPFAKIPTGADIDGTTGTTNGNTLTTGIGAEWREITLDSVVRVTAGTTYAIVIRALTGAVGNYIVWRWDDDAATYEGGNKAHTLDGGSSWGAPSFTEDLMFEEWGNIVYTAYPTDAITRATSLKHIYNREAGIYDLEIGLGEIAADFSIPDVELVSKSSSPIDEEAKEVERIAEEAGVTPAIINKLNRMEEQAQIDFPIPTREVPQQAGTGIRTTPEHQRILTEQFEDPMRLIPKGGGGVQEIQDLVAELKGRATPTVSGQFHEAVSGEETSRIITNTPMGKEGLATERQRMRELQEQGLSREEINRIIAEQ